MDWNPVLDFCGPRAIGFLSSASCDFQKACKAYVEKYFFTLLESVSEKSKKQLLLQYCGIEP